MSSHAILIAQKPCNHFLSLYVINAFTRHSYFQSDFYNHSFYFLTIVLSFSRHDAPPSSIVKQRNAIWDFVNAHCIPMHLGNTKLCPRNTNCSDDLCVIHDRDDSADGSFVMCCIVLVFPAANDFTRYSANPARIAIRPPVIKRKDTSLNVLNVINCSVRSRSTSMSWRKVWRWLNIRKRNCQKQDCMLIDARSFNSKEHKWMFNESYATYIKSW